MTLKTTPSGLTRGVRVCVPLMAILGLLIAGCAGKRSDLLSSLLPSGSGEDDSEMADDTETADDSRLIAGNDEKESTWLSAFRRDDDTPRRSMGDRVRSLLGRGESEVATSDPFVDDAVEDAEKSETSRKQTIAKNERPTVEELLASFEREATKPAEEIRPWWEETEDAATASEQSSQVANDKSSFSQEFDSRLEELRVELMPTIEPDVKRDADDQTVVSATAHPLSDGLKERARELFGQAAHPLSADKSTQEAGESAQARVEAMLAEARRERESGDILRAYRTALNAQELAVLEDVSFLPGEMAPDDLVDDIAAHLQAEPIAQVSSETLADKTALPDISPMEHFSRPNEEFNFPDSSLVQTSGLWDESGANSPASDAEAEAVPDIEDSPGSGVSLLPPDDDFPSEAAGIWQNSENGKSAGVQSDKAGIRLATHRTSGFTLRRDSEPKEQFPGLSDEENEELLTTVANQRNRVFEQRSIEWPSLRNSKNVAKGLQEPIRVAQAPRFTPDDQHSLAVDAPAAIPAPGSSQGSLLNQIWRSQPVWFIAGLVLLVLALRLSPWPRNETE